LGTSWRYTLETTCRRRPPEEPRLDAERVLVFDDVQLDRKGQIKPPGWWVESHNGREGSTRLVNGRQEPPSYLEIHPMQVKGVIHGIAFTINRESHHRPSHAEWASCRCGRSSTTLRWMLTVSSHERNCGRSPFTSRT
jgi:hypothetical protein